MKDMVGYLGAVVPDALEETKGLTFNGVPNGFNENYRLDIL